MTDSIPEAILLIDEEKGRKVAKNMGLKIMGTIGILVAAYEDKILDSQDIQNCIEIIKNSNLRISENLIKMLFNKIN